jgi:hypothetical protein
MASLIFNSAVRDMATGAVDFDSDTFYALLVTSSYTPNKDTHTRRSDVTNEVTGTGYTAGGAATVATVAAVDTTNDRVDVSFGDVNWSTATITARAAVIYKRRGGASSADELIAYVDFTTDKTSTAGTFSLSFTTPFRLQNS